MASIDRITIESRTLETETASPFVRHRAVAIDGVPLWSFTIGTTPSGAWQAMTLGLPTLNALVGSALPESRLGPFETELDAARAINEQLLRDLAWLLAFAEEQLCACLQEPVPDDVSPRIAVESSDLKGEAE